MTQPSSTAAAATTDAPPPPSLDLKRRASDSPRPTLPKRTKSTTDDAPHPTAQHAGVESIFKGFRDEIDSHNHRRDRLIKISRDVTSLSKKLIFHLHRYTFPLASSSTDSESNEQGASSKKNDKLFQEADTKIQEIVAILWQTCEAEGLGMEEERGGRAYRYERNLGGGVEEFVEALSFYHFLRFDTLITHAQAQYYFTPSTPSPSSATSWSSLLLPIDRYLLGLSDLTGELMRLATNAVGSGVSPSYVLNILHLLREIRDGLDPFVPFVKDMKKKQQVTTQSLRKVEDVMYAIAVRTSEFKQDPKALQEMVRRALMANPATSHPGGGGGGDDGDE